MRKIQLFTLFFLCLVAPAFLIYPARSANFYYWGFLDSANGYVQSAWTNPAYYYGIKFTADFTGTLDHVSLFLSAINDDYGLPWYRVGIQGISGVVPDGSWIGDYTDFNTLGASNYWYNLTVSCDLVAGVVYALVLQYLNGTIDGSHNFYFYPERSISQYRCYLGEFSLDNNFRFMYSYNSGTTWTIYRASYPIVFAMDDGSEFGDTYDSALNTQMRLNSVGENFTCPYNMSIIAVQLFTLIAGGLNSNDSLYCSLWDLTLDEAVFSDLTIDETSNQPGVWTTTTGAWIGGHLDNKYTIIESHDYMLWFYSNATYGYQMYMRSSYRTSPDDSWGGTNNMCWTSIGNTSPDPPNNDAYPGADLSFRFLVYNLTATEGGGGVTYEDRLSPSDLAILVIGGFILIPLLILIVWAATKRR